MREELAIEWLGRLRYEWALRLQRLRRDAIVHGSSAEVLWLLEHEPVITVGRRPAVVPPPEVLAAQGIDFACTERGGLATWHGPGQLIGYVLAHAGRRDWQVKRVIAQVEEGLIRWLASQGVTAHRREGHPGVWVGTDKIAAIGMNFHRGVSMHGFSLNLNPSFDGYSWIVPCGIAEAGVTSLAVLTGRVLESHQVGENVGEMVRSALLEL